MKRIALTLFLFFSFTSIGLTTKTIHQAVQEGLVKIDYTSTGMMNGASVRLDISILKGGAFKMNIPGGTVFRTIDPGKQDMLVVENQDLLVSSKTKTYYANGFCCQSYNAVPRESEGFTLDTYIHDGIQKLVQFLPQKNIDQNLIQDAIWNLCNKEVPSSLYDESNVHVAELRKMICSINQVEEPWYEKKRRIQIDEQRQVQRLPVSVEAKLAYKVEKPGGKLSYDVINAQGEVIRTYQSKAVFSEKGEYNMGFKLTVEGWDEGSYTLILKMDQKVLKEYPFEV